MFFLLSTFLIFSAPAAAGNSQCEVKIAGSDIYQIWRDGSLLQTAQAGEALEGYMYELRHSCTFKKLGQSCSVQIREGREQLLIDGKSVLEGVWGQNGDRGPVQDLFVSITTPHYEPLPENIVLCRAAPLPDCSIRDNKIFDSFGNVLFSLESFRNQSYFMDRLRSLQKARCDPSKDFCFPLNLSDSEEFNAILKMTLVDQDLQNVCRSVSDER